jgi:lysophospholipase L1-like esterase
MGDTPGLDTIAQVAAESAGATGVPFVPIADVVTATNAARYTGPDAKHPTPDGHVFLGQRLAPLIARAFDA